MKSLINKLYDKLQMFSVWKTAGIEFLICMATPFYPVINVLLELWVYLMSKIPISRYSLRRIAGKQIREHQKKNETCQKYRYSWLYRIVDQIDEYKILVYTIWLLAMVAPTIWVNITPFKITIPYVNQFEVPSFEILVAANNEASDDYLSLMATIQTAVLALTIPISVALHEFILKERRLKKEMVGFILREAKVFLIAINALAFMSWVILSGLMKTGLQWSHASVFTNPLESIWILLCLILLANFMYKTLNLVDRTFLGVSIRRHTINTVYPQEVKGYLERNILLNLNSFNKNPEDGTAWPQVFTSSMSGYGTGTADVFLAEPKVLYDINIKYLEYVIQRWVARNKRSLENENSTGINSMPSLIFPISFGQQYIGKVTICKIDGDGTPLTNYEKSLVRNAFKFKPQIQKERGLDSKKCLTVFTDYAVHNILNREKGMFDEALNDLIELHTLLIQAGETVDDTNRPENYGIIQTSLLSRGLHYDWARAYEDIFEESTSALNIDSHFFQQCCSTAGRVATNVLEIPSMTGVNSVIEIQGFLWFRLHGKFENIESKKIYSLTKAHDRALKDYIGSWDNLQKHTLHGKIDEVSKWEAYANLFQAFDQHLNATILFLARSVLSGNHKTAYYWADCLMRWNKSRRGYDDIEIRHYISKSHQSLVSPALLGKPWAEVKSILEVKPKQGKQEQLEKVIFCKILQNYWQDTCMELIEFLFLQAKDNNNPKGPLAVDIAKRLISRKVYDNADAHDLQLFIKDFDHFMSSFIRRNTSVRWDGGYYGGLLSTISTRLNRLTKPDMIPSRMYATSTSISITNTFETDLILGGLKIYESVETTTDKLKIYEKLLDKEEVAYSLQQAIEGKLEAIKSIDLKACSKIFDSISAKVEESEDANQNNPGRVETTVEFSDKLSILEAVLVNLQDKIKEVRSARICSLPVSKEKLKQIAVLASSKAFDAKTAEFPVSQFSNVEIVSDPLTKSTIRYPNYRKGLLTEPLMDHTIVATDTHHNLVGSQLYLDLVFDIHKKAEENNLIQEEAFQSESEFSGKLVTIVNSMKEQGLAPIIVTESFDSPEWLMDWEHTIWQSDVEPPAGIVINRQNGLSEEWYMYDVCDAPTFNGRINSGGTIILPKEVLSLVKFRRMSSGCPVEVTFRKKPENAWRGTITYHWEREIELDTSLKIYKLVHIKV